MVNMSAKFDQEAMVLSVLGSQLISMHVSTVTLTFDLQIQRVERG